MVLERQIWNEKSDGLGYLEVSYGDVFLAFKEISQC